MSAWGGALVATYLVFGVEAEGDLSHRELFKPPSNPFAKRRCLIPATGFYEWQQRDDGKQPFRFRRKDLEPFAFAGIWEFNRLGGEEILSAAMIVGEPNPLVGGVHDRMPVMLMMEDYDRWLSTAASLDELRAMLRPYDANLMEAYAVSRAVNSVKNDSEECIEPGNEAISAAK